ncbi:MAG: hypothetical protein AAGG47_13730 [Pseudomonadota bacterium]
MADVYDFWANRQPQADLDAIDAFWAAFTVQSARFDAMLSGRERASGSDTIPGLMAEALGPLAHRIFWEFGPGEASPDGPGFFLALTPELYGSKRPLARAFVNRAPTLAGWSFGDARRSLPSTEPLLDLVASRAFGQQQLTGAWVAPGTHRRIDVIGQGRGDGIDGQAGLLFSLVLGEAVERDWLGELTAKPMPPKGLAERLRRSAAENRPTWIDRFAEEARALHQTLANDLPHLPFAPSRNQAEATLFNVTPRKDDWPRADMITYRTTRPDYAAARFAAVTIAAPRFSSMAESFLALRLARTPEHPFEEIEEREILATAIDTALREAEIGGVFGEGHGHEHVYVDFAVTEIAKAIDVVGRVLREGGQTAPGHILFDEDGLTDLTLPVES